jgi:mono/diheme cytochrome c family protein
VRVAVAFTTLVLALGVVAAGCGGDGDDEGTATVATETETTETETTETTETGDGDLMAQGASVYESAGCGGCHTLDAAGSTGTVGPDLNGAGLSVDEVSTQVRNGGGAMPSFSDTLSEEEILAVSEYVSESSQ